jgi:hypothetical protein
MTYKEFKQTDEFKSADVLEVFDLASQMEFAADFPESVLEKMEVDCWELRGGWLTVVLKWAKPKKLHGYIEVEIPKSCRECRLFYHGFVYFCTGHECTTSEQSEWLEHNYAACRPDWCPIKIME